MIIFIYDIRFAQNEMPPDRKDAFEEALRQFAWSNGLDVGMSALGGIVRCAGDVQRAIGTDATEEDRRTIAEWMTRQPVKCTAQIGALELLTEQTLLFRPITDWVFDVDNLTPEDRSAAEAWWSKIMAGLRSRKVAWASGLAEGVRQTPQKPVSVRGVVLSIRPDRLRVRLPDGREIDAAIPKKILWSAFRIDVGEEVELVEKPTPKLARIFRLWRAGRAIE